jgi:hypothetical protein
VVVVDQRVMVVVQEVLEVVEMALLEDQLTHIR